MTTRSDREFLKVQLLEIQRLKKLTAGHPIMSKALAVREQMLETQFQALPQGQSESCSVCFLAKDDRGMESGMDQG